MSKSPTGYFRKLLGHSIQHVHLVPSAVEHYMYGVLSIPWKLRLFMSISTSQWFTSFKRLCMKLHTSGGVLSRWGPGWGKIGAQLESTSSFIVAMMTSSNGNIFRVTGHLCGEFTGFRGEFPTQRPVTRSLDVFFDLRLNKRLSSTREAGDLRCYRAHYDVIVMQMRWRQVGTR